VDTVMFTTSFVLSSVSSSTPTQKRAETCSCFLQQIENTVVLRRKFILLISTSIESHNGDDATKDPPIYVLVSQITVTVIQTSQQPMGLGYGPNNREIEVRFPGKCNFFPKKLPE
jgi:hypothetical protein